VAKILVASLWETTGINQSVLMRGGFAQPCLKVYRTTTEEGNRKHLEQNQGEAAI